MITKTQIISSYPKFSFPTKELISIGIFSKQPTTLFEHCFQYICNSIQHFEIKEETQRTDENTQSEPPKQKINYLEYLSSEILSELIKRVSDCTLLNFGVLKSFPLESLLQLDLQVC